MSGNQVPANGTLLSQLNIPNTQLIGMTDVTNRIDELRNKLNKSLPGIETTVAQIHKILAEDQSLAHILTDDQVGVICAGLTKAKQVSLITKKAGSGSKKSLSKTTVADLG